MRATQWSPAPIPPELQRYAKRCESCEKPRRMLSTFVGVLADPHFNTVQLLNRGYTVDFTDLDIRCRTCGDTGWIITSEIRELLRRAKALLEPAGDGGESATVGQGDGQAPEDLRIVEPELE